MRDIFHLPDVLIALIKEYVPPHWLVHLDRQHYVAFHPALTARMASTSVVVSCVRDTIRRDNAFVFQRFVDELCANQWFTMRQYVYKQQVFRHFVYFLQYFCIEHEAHCCRQVLQDFLDEHGYCQNQHKKRPVRYIQLLPLGPDNNGDRNENE